MTCEQVRAELVECWACTDELSDEAIRHLESCEACRREAVLLRGTRTLVHSLPTTRAPAGFTDRVMAQINREPQPADWTQRLRDWLVPRRGPAWVRATAVAAAIALAAAGGVWYANQTPEAQAGASAVTVAPGAIDAQSTSAEGELTELLQQHQSFELTQPLADDAGVSFVAYTSE